MHFTPSDLASTVATALAVAVYTATHEAWPVWLVGDDHRWASAMIVTLGLIPFGLALDASGGMLRGVVYLGVAAFALAIVALVTGALTPLSLLVAAIALIWAVSLADHLHGRRHRTLTV
jgi:hypothetical protein